MLILAVDISLPDQNFLPFSVLEVNMVFSNFVLAKTSQHGWKEHLKVKQVAKFMNADVLC